MAAVTNIVVHASKGYVDGILASASAAGANAELALTNATLAVEKATLALDSATSANALAESANGAAAALEADVEMAKADAEAAKENSETALADAETARVDAEAAKENSETALADAKTAKVDAAKAASAVVEAQKVARRARELANDALNVVRGSSSPLLDDDGNLYVPVAEKVDGVLHYKRLCLAHDPDMEDWGLEWSGDYVKDETGAFVEAADEEAAGEATVEGEA